MRSWETYIDKEVSHAHKIKVSDNGPIKVKKEKAMQQPYHDIM